jgi:hypothetical protein
MIKAACAGDTPNTLMLDLERSVHMLALCAGNFPSVDAPLVAQYLAAHQRINDFHAGLLLDTPEELLRVGALIRAGLVVRDACAAVEAWREESGA